MSSKTDFKLGIFALSALIGLLAAALTLGIHVSHSATVMFHTYFDESVEGLDIGAPVSYRGVRIGRVAAIDIARDRRHIELRLEINGKDARRLELATPPSTLRADLASQGITAIKFVDLDFDSRGEPPEPLSFPPGPRYLPSRPSLLKRLGDEVDGIGRDAHTLVRGGMTTLQRVDGLLDNLRDQQLPTRMAGFLDRSSNAATQLDQFVANLNHRGISDKAAAAIAQVTDAANSLHQVLDHVGGNDGLVPSVQRAIDEIGAMARSTRSSTNALERTIRDSDDAVQTFHDFINELDRNPAMLFKGRAKVNER